MLLETMEAQDFRNLGGKIEWGKGLNILVGENGQGKTNWLEAINLLATTRSFRTPRLGETIRFDKELAIVRGRIRHSEEIKRDLQVTLEKNIKNFSINGKRETVKRYFGELSAFVFSSYDLEIVRGQPEERRQFLDRGIVSLHPPFIQTFSDYTRVIRQKNALLHTARENEYPPGKTAEMLQPWHEQLIPLAARIHRGRVRFVERLNEALRSRLFGREEVSIRYVSALEGKGNLSDYESLIAERLTLRLQAELAAGYTLIGPHRDDLEILFDGHELRRFGSAGQQRSALLILLLAGISVFYATRGEYPLFLLDEIDAELDYRRIGQLLEFLEGKTQTFVTTSKWGFVTEFGRGAAVIRVEEGNATQQVPAAA